MRHKHADLIIAWANGAQIQYKSINDKTWRDLDFPAWDSSGHYRIKPEPKPDCVRYYEVCKGFGGLSQMHYHNLKATYDGETGELKSAEVIKWISARAVAQI